MRHGSGVCSSYSTMPVRHAMKSGGRKLEERLEDRGISSVGYGHTPLKMIVAYIIYSQRSTRASIVSEFSFSDETPLLLLHHSILWLWLRTITPRGYLIMLSVEETTRSLTRLRDAQRLAHSLDSRAKAWPGYCKLWFQVTRTQKSA